MSAIVVTALVTAGLMVVASIVMLSVYRVMLIPSGAMEPTLPVHSAIVVNRLDRSPKDGDIVVFRAQDSFDGGGGTFVKRVLAQPGEAIGCCTDGAVTRNGTSLVEPYTMPGDAEIAFPQLTVPAGRLWVMGDHRANSADSRFHQSDAHQGTVARADVTGVVVFHGSRASAYAWVLGRAVLIAVPLGLLVGLVLALVRRFRHSTHEQVPV